MIRPTGVLRAFIREFFDQNPLSHLGILLLRDGVAERLTDLSGSPVCAEWIQSWLPYPLAQGATHPGHGFLKPFDGRGRGQAAWRPNGALLILLGQLRGHSAVDSA